MNYYRSVINVLDIPDLIDSRAGDEQALEALYSSTNGAAWTDNTGWAASGMSLDNTIYGVETTLIESELRVTKIDLYKNNLDGTLPQEIENLKKNAHLNVKGNLLTGDITDAISKIGGMSALQVLILGGRTYDISGTEKEPNFSDLTKAYHPGKFSSSTNRFTGVIPSSIGSISTLEFLEISDQPGVTGPIPSEIGNLSNLKGLYLNWNDFTGETIPASFANLSELRHLYIAECDLTGTMFDTSLLTNLTYIEITSTSTSGTGLTGDVPDLTGATNIRSIVFDNNQLDGVYPSYFNNGDFTQLVTLRFIWNDLTGSLHGFNNLPNVESLGLEGNNLTGTIDTQLLQMASNIQIIGLGWNNFSGELPQTGWQNFSNLKTIYLNNNGLTGAIPCDFWINVDNPALNICNLSNNQFTSNCIAEMNNVVGNGDPDIIDVSNNTFTYSTDFSEYTTGQAPPDWTKIWNTGQLTATVEDDASLLGGKYLRLQTTADGNLVGIVKDGLQSNQQEILAKVQIGSSTYGAYPFGRLRGAIGSENGLGTYPDANINGFASYSINNGATSGDDPIPISSAIGVGDYVWCRFQLNGTNLKAKAWKDGDAEPATYSYDTTSATFTDEAGNMGFVVFESSVDYRIDYFAVGINGAAAPTPNTFAGDSLLADTDGLVLDFDPLIAGKVVTETVGSDTTVASFEDSSESNYVLTQPDTSKRPIYDSANNELEPDGIDDSLITTIAPFSTENCSFFGAMRGPKATGIDIVFSMYPAGLGDDAHIHGVVGGWVDEKATFWFGDGTNYEMIQEPNAGGYSQYGKFSITKSPSGTSVKVEGVEIGSSATNYFNTVDTFQLFGRGTQAFGQADLKTFIAYNVTKASSQEQNLLTHVQNRFLGGVVVPQLSNILVDQVTADSAQGHVDTDVGNGTLYWLVNTSVSATATEIETANSQAIISVGTQDINITGLTADQNYYLHTYQKDGVGTESNILSSGVFTSSSANQFFRDFNSDTLNELPANFVTLFNSGESDWQIVENATLGANQYLRHVGANGRGAVGWEQGTDIEVVTKYYRVGSGIIGGPAVRMDTTGIQTGYTTWARAGGAGQSIVRHENGTETTLIANGFSVDTNRVISRMRINGSDVQLRLHPVEADIIIRDTNNDIVYEDSNFLQDNFEVQFEGDALPAELTAGTTYYVRAIDDNQIAIQASSPVDGGASDIDFTSAGTNVRMIVTENEEVRSDWTYTLVDANISGNGYAGLFDIFGSCYFEWIGIGINGETAPSS